MHNRGEALRPRTLCGLPDAKWCFPTPQGVQPKFSRIVTGTLRLGRARIGAIQQRAQVAARDCMEVLRIHLPAGESVNKAQRALTVSGPSGHENNVLTTYIVSCCGGWRGTR